MKEVEVIIEEGGHLAKEVIETIDWDLFPFVMGVSFAVLFVINIVGILIHK